MWMVECSACGYVPRFSYECTEGKACPKCNGHTWITYKRGAPAHPEVMDRREKKETPLKKPEVSDDDLVREFLADLSSDDADDSQHEGA